jgi:hypothetical protein
MDELADGTSSAVLLCYSNFRISMYDASEFSKMLIVGFGANDYTTRTCSLLSKFHSA